MLGLLKINFNYVTVKIIEKKSFNDLTFKKNIFLAKLENSLGEK